MAAPRRHTFIGLPEEPATLRRKPTSGFTNIYSPVYAAVNNNTNPTDFRPQPVEAIKVPTPRPAGPRVYNPPAAWGSNRQYREYHRRFNAYMDGPDQSRVPGTYQDELLTTMKEKAAGRFTKNMAKKNAYRAEQIMGIRKIHDPDEIETANEHPYQYAMDNDKLINIIKRTKKMHRELESRPSFLDGVTPAAMITQNPHTMAMHDKKHGSVVYSGPDGMVTPAATIAATYMKKGDVFTPIRGGVYNKKAKKEAQKLERLQLKREELQEAYNDGYK